MGFLKLCNDDPLLSLLKDTFKANPIKVPEERILPLIVVAKSGAQNKYIGKIENLLTDNSAIGIEVQQSQMANLSATKSKTVNTELGLQVMDGFLKGLGSNGASLDFAFKGATKVSFRFENVVRKYVDVGLTCRNLSRRVFDIANPVTRQFIEENSHCVVIDSTITSNNFSMKVEESSKTDFSFDLPKIQDILSSEDNSLEITVSANLEISFKGAKHLAFAFSGFVVEVGVDGSISYKGEPDRMNLTVTPDEEDSFTPELVVLDTDMGLAEIDFE